MPLLPREFAFTNMNSGTPTFRAAGNILLSGGDRSIINSANSALILGTNNGEKWRITDTGVLRSTGGQFIESSTSNLSLRTIDSDGLIRFLPHN
jgi:hypothetical protein